MTITGANGYSRNRPGDSGLRGRYPSGYQQVSNRDQLDYQGDYKFTPHLTALIGFHYEDERGRMSIPPMARTTRRTHQLRLPGQRAWRLQRPVLLYAGRQPGAQFALRNQTSPRAGLSYYAVRPRKGIFSGTRILFNYGDGVREPKLTEQFGSLYTFLRDHSMPRSRKQLHIGPLAAPATRTYEGGVEQAFLASG